MQAEDDGIDSPRAGHEHDGGVCRLQQHHWLGGLLGVRGENGSLVQGGVGWVHGDAAHARALGAVDVAADAKEALLAPRGAPRVLQPAQQRVTNRPRRLDGGGRGGESSPRTLTIQ
jgi:hypothetical protein